MTYPLDQILLSNEIHRDWLADNKADVEAGMQEILDRAVAKTNERMIGNVSPEQMKIRRGVAFPAVVGLAFVFSVMGWLIGRLFSRNSAGMSRSASGKSWIPCLCLGPAVVLILVWHYMPLARGALMAFLDYQLFLKSTFVGLDNFCQLQADPRGNRPWRIRFCVRHVFYMLRQAMDAPVVYASLILTAIPTLLVFIFCQNIILRGIVVPTEK